MNGSAGADMLEPSLLDRLLDDERTIGEVSVTLDSDRLAEFGSSPDSMFDALERRGWVRVTGLEVGNPLQAVFHVPRTESSLPRCRAVELPSREGARHKLEQLGEVSVRFVVNSQLERAEQRRLSARRLREAITRDLGWLLNTLSLAATQSLETYPEVARSVINYGTPSLAGRTVSNIDEQMAARRIQEAIERFEPRLSGVRVTVNRDEAGMGDNELDFEIEAEMWSYPNMQRVVLDTRIDVASGDVKVIDQG
jgi:type VI secretion system protein ImpF